LTKLSNSAVLYHTNLSCSAPEKENFDCVKVKDRSESVTSSDRTDVSFCPSPTASPSLAKLHKSSAHILSTLSTSIDDCEMGSSGSLGLSKKEQKEQKDQKGNRGRYKCSRCGALKTNHYCPIIEEYTGDRTTCTEIIDLTLDEFNSQTVYRDDPQSPSSISTSGLQSAGLGPGVLRIVTVRPNYIPMSGAIMTKTLSLDTPPEPVEMKESDGIASATTSKKSWNENNGGGEDEGEGEDDEEAVSPLTCERFVLKRPESDSAEDCISECDSRYEKSPRYDDNCMIIRVTTDKDDITRKREFASKKREFSSRRASGNGNALHASCDVDGDESFNGSANSPVTTDCGADSDSS